MSTMASKQFMFQKFVKPSKQSVHVYEIQKFEFRRQPSFVAHYLNFAEVGMNLFSYSNSNVCACTVPVDSLIRARTGLLCSTSFYNILVVL